MISNIINNLSIRQLQREVRNARSIVITCHLSPDGDAIGSSLALQQVLRRNRKTTHIVIPDMVPRSLNFLPMVETAVVYTRNEQYAVSLINEADLIICLDFNALHRIGMLGDFVSKSQAFKVLIDHHIAPERFTEVMISHPDASSTCELLYRVLMQAGWLQWLNPDGAACLLTGMMTDTGNFTYSCNDPEIYEIEADLMRYGIDKHALYNAAMNTFSADSLRIQGYAISRKMRLDMASGGALVTLDKEELTRFDYHRGDTEGLVNKPLAIPGINWVVFLREDPEYIKVSMRSEGDFAVNGICTRYFGGGGHKNAAGGEFHGSMEDAEKMFDTIIHDINEKQ